MSIGAAILISPVVTENPPLRLAPREGQSDRHPHAVGDRVRDGSLARASGAAIKVFVAIANQADQRRQASPSLQTVAELAGVARSTVSDAITELIRLGFIARVQGGGGRTTTCYRVLHDRGDGPERGARPGGEQAPAGAGAWRPAYRAPPPSSGSALQINSSSSPSPASAGVLNSEEQRAVDHKRQSLVRAWIGEPVLSELANHPLLKPSQVDDKIESAQARGKGTGVIVNDLRALIERNKADAERKRTPPAQPPPLPAPRATVANDDVHSTRLLAAEARLRLLPRDEVDRIVTHVLPTLTPFERRRVGDLNALSSPLDSKALVMAMCRYLISTEPSVSVAPSSATG